MDTALLKRFAREARLQLVRLVGVRLEQVLGIDSAEMRGWEGALKELREEIRVFSREVVVERVAYVWFNRFCALRFMDVNGYHERIPLVLSSGEGFTQPEILRAAKQGHIDERLMSVEESREVFDLLSGVSVSAEPQQEAYRKLLVSVCNYYHGMMPFLFRAIDDYTQLLMPVDLLSRGSVPAAVRDALTPDNCGDVEVIGWLYQFYIAEKKDEVFEGLKKNRKITARDIPAATQLFTPNWIVRYLVENSLGRLWKLNRPGSALDRVMDYYIAPESEESGFIRVESVEEIRICDPACGSGHMLVYAFELLYAIYEEEGYNPPDIPRLILENNLYGVEIDERAGELAAFALVMKAREKYRRFLRKAVQPRICVLEKITFEAGELDGYMDHVEENIFTLDLQAVLWQFEQADNLGSLIRPSAADVSGAYAVLSGKRMAGQLFLKKTHEKVLKVLRQAEYLKGGYHIVIANPPYMGGKGMNEALKKYAKVNYPDSKSDLFAMFIERIMGMVSRGCFIGLMTPFTWMFLGSYEKLRKLILNRNKLSSLIKPEYHAFFESAFVPICAFTMFTEELPDNVGAFIDLNDFYGAGLQPVKALEAINNPNCSWFYRASTSDFKKIPGSPIAYWASERLREIFVENTNFGNIALPKQGSTIGDNDQFLRYWFEVSSPINNKWKYTVKGGEFRRWYGNLLYIVNWGNQGEAILSTGRATIRNKNFLFKPGVEWSRISSDKTSFRILQSNFFHESASGFAFPKEWEKMVVLGILNTKIIRRLLGVLNMTMTFQSGDIAKLPYIKYGCDEIVKSLIGISQADWNAYEISWDFEELEILNSKYRGDTLEETYINLRNKWKSITLEMQRLEQENNQMAIDAYGLGDELTPEVPLEEITLTCNPAYRYGKGKSQAQLESLLLADTMKEFISYAVGCMFGRYALERPGLILAGQGQGVEEYLAAVPQPRFMPDEDNVIPVLDGDWFHDDIVGRFRHFLKLTFGDARFSANLDFIEKALGKDIRKYFLKDFYPHHVKQYRKRPIYWMFSSPCGSFNCLMYLHRYREDTVSVVLNEYLRQYLGKLSSRVENLQAAADAASATASEKTRAAKERDDLAARINRLRQWEREVLYPLATAKVALNLDDGVKMNYPKLGPALKKIAGLSK